MSDRGKDWGIALVLAMVGRQKSGGRWGGAVHAGGLDTDYCPLPGIACCCLCREVEQLERMGTGRHHVVYEGRMREGGRRVAIRREVEGALPGAASRETIRYEAQTG